MPVSGSGGEMHRIPGRQLPASLVLLAALALSCSGGSDGGTGLASPCLGFSPAGSAGPSTVTTREAAGSNCDVAILEIVATDVDDLFTASFTVQFDPAIVRYDGLGISDSILASDGAQVEALEQEQTGQVTVGVSRVATSSGIDVVATQVILSISFRRAAPGGATSLDYSNTNLLGSETPPQVKPGIQWVGGSLMIQ
jgi:hypothetical protein